MSLKTAAAEGLDKGRGQDFKVWQPLAPFLPGRCRSVININNNRFSPVSAALSANVLITAM